MLVFFFKQKTAYEMRISDWSSDVCSSDLIAEFSLSPFWRGVKRAGSSPPSPESDLAPMRFIAMLSVPCASGDSAPSDMPGVTKRLRIAVIDSTRSEEHTSELQSLMRISYAVLCLKKKRPPSHNKTYYPLDQRDIN